LTQVEPKPVLVVDDDADCRQVIDEILSGAGVSVTQACDGKQALVCMRCSNEPALVVLDLEMPVMSGVELLARMKADERLSSVPVLILSGTRESNAPLGHPVIGFLAKPCSMQGLVATVKNALGLIA
jgi:CheY-like chemotaxis protein